jgi:hypothetical protein
MAASVHFQEQSDVFYKEIHGLAPGGQPAPIALVKAHDGSNIYIAYNAISKSLKSQGLKIGHCTLWASLGKNPHTINLKKNKDDPAGRDANIIAAIQNAACAHYKKKCAFQMNLAPIVDFINYTHTKAGWKPMKVIEALLSTDGYDWIQTSPVVDLGDLVEQLNASNVVFSAEPAPHTRFSDPVPDQEPEDMHTCSSSSDDLGQPDANTRSGAQRMNYQGDNTASTSNPQPEQPEQNQRKPRPDDDPDGAWTEDGSWGLGKRQKLSTITHIFDTPEYMQKTFKLHTWCNVLGITEAVMHSSHEPKHKHFMSWMQHANGGLSRHVKSVPNLSSNPYLAYTVHVPMADGCKKWGFELYLIWCTHHAQLTSSTTAERMASATLVLEWLMYDEYDNNKAMCGRVREVMDRLGMLEKRFGNGRGRKHHTKYHDKYMNAFQLSHLMENFAEPRIEKSIEEYKSQAMASWSAGRGYNALLNFTEAAMRKHDLVKVKFLNFSVPPITRPGFMKTMQVSLDAELAKTMPDVPPPICHKKCGRATCRGNVVHFSDDGSVCVYFPHFKNEGKLDPDLNFRLNNNLADAVKDFVLKREGKPDNVSDWERLTNTAKVRQYKSLLFGQMNTVSRTWEWHPMEDPTLASTFWCVALGCPNGPMKHFVGIDTIKSEWSKMGLDKMLKDCEPSPPQRIRNMIASAAVMLMDVGEPMVLQLVADKQRMDAVLDLVGGAMLSGKGSLHHYTADEGHRMLSAGVQLLSLIRKHNNNPRLLATKSVRLTMQQPD